MIRLSALARRRRALAVFLICAMVAAGLRLCLRRGRESPIPAAAAVSYPRELLVDLDTFLIREVAVRDDAAPGGARLLMGMRERSIGGTNYVVAALKVPRGSSGAALTEAPAVYRVVPSVDPHAGTLTRLVRASPAEEERVLGLH